MCVRVCVHVCVCVCVCVCVALTITIWLIGMSYIPFILLLLLHSSVILLWGISVKRLRAQTVTVNICIEFYSLQVVYKILWQVQFPKPHRSSGREWGNPLPGKCHSFIWNSHSKLLTPALVEFPFCHSAKERESGEIEVKWERHHLRTSITEFSPGSGLAFCNLGQSGFSACAISFQS